MERESLNFFSLHAGGNAENIPTPPRLALALLNSAAPVLRDRFAPSRRNCTLRVRSLVAELCSASRYSLSSSQFCEEDGRERKVRVFKNQCALPQERKRAEIKETNHGQGPECRGAKSSFAISCSDRGCQTGMRACSFCKGEGQVTSEAAECWRTGDFDTVKRPLSIL